MLNFMENAIKKSRLARFLLFLDGNIKGQVTEFVNE